jgi:MFS family permease
MGGAVGTLIGGVLTQLTAAKWRSVFFLMAGLGLLCFMGGVLVIDKDTPSTEPDRRVDWIGAFLVTTGLVLIVFVLSDGSIAEHGWSTGYIIALLIIGVILVIFFVFWQHYLERIHSDPERAHTATAWWQPPPLMKLSIWTRMKGRMAVMLWIAFLEWCSFFSWSLWAQVRICCNYTAQGKD